MSATGPYFPSKPSNSTEQDSSDCNVCVKLLQQILLNATSSRPRKLLESLGPTAWRPIVNGIQVEIPSPQTEPTQNWDQIERIDGNSHVDVSEDSAHHVLLPRRKTSQLAFSSKVEHDLPDAAFTSNEKEGKESAKKEWLSIVCRECTSTGPEGNARAFITGPTPLSVVICTNRSGVNEMEEILVHELVHVYDVRKLQLDLRSCENLAYSEVRAAKQAECYGGWFTSTHCISQKAYTATQNLFPPRASQQCVQTVLKAALRDNRPFADNHTAATAKGVTSEQ